MLDDGTRYRLLRLLDEHPEYTQRDLAEHMGVSLGKANYCIKALIDLGWIKIGNFRNSQNKKAYLYQLTPAGVGEKLRVTRRFLARKLREYEEITTDIERLKREVHETDAHDH